MNNIKIAMKIFGPCIFLVVFAQADALHDSVATKEARALNNPSSVKSTEAKRKVNQTRMYDLALAKESQIKGAFKDEAQADKVKRLKRVVNKEVNQHKQTLTKTPREVIDALKATMIALQTLQQNNPAEAKKALQRATKLFDKVLKENPRLAFVPVVDEVDIHQFRGNTKLIEKLKDAAIDALQNNDTQVARAILLPLQDEVILTTQLLPLDLYPDATKMALKALNKGKSGVAFSTLITALNTIVVQTITVPLPLLAADDFVLSASKLDKSDKKGALKLLNVAQEELEKAVLLGYSKKYSSEYTSMQKKIESIKKEIKGKNRVEKLYEDLVNSFKSLIGKNNKDVVKKK